MSLFSWHPFSTLEGVRNVAWKPRARGTHTDANAEAAARGARRSAPGAPARPDASALCFPGAPRRLALESLVLVRCPVSDRWRDWTAGTPRRPALSPAAHAGPRILVKWNRSAQGPVLLKILSGADPNIHSEFPSSQGFQEWSAHVAAMQQNAPTPVCLRPISAPVLCPQHCFCLTASPFYFIVLYVYWKATVHSSRTGRN